MSLFLSIHLSVCLSVCCAPYFRNCTLSNDNFWYTCVKWWYVQEFCSFFEILIFWVFRGVKEQKIAQNEKKKKIYVARAISQEQYSIWSWFLVHLCKMMISPGVPFIFFEIFIFGLLGQKNGPRWQKNFVWCTSCLRNHVSYDCHLRYTFAKWRYLQVFVSFFQN